MPLIWSSGLENNRQHLLASTLYVFNSSTIRITEPTDVCFLIWLDILYLQKKKSKYVTDAITLTIPQKLLLPVQVQTSPNSGIDWREIYDKLGASGSG